MEWNLPRPTIESHVQGSKLIFPLPPSRQAWRPLVLVGPAPGAFSSHGSAFWEVGPSGSPSSDLSTDPLLLGEASDDIVGFVMLHGPSVMDPTTSRLWKSKASVQLNSLIGHLLRKCLSLFDKVHSQVSVHQIATLLSWRKPLERWYTL